MKTTTAGTWRAAFDATRRGANALARGAIRGYKLLLSPFFAGSCRFVPSCADYADEAIARFGLVQGSWLAAKRLARCHPLCHGGHDPVPQHPSSDARSSAEAA